jgi:endonuclease VIII
MPEGDTIFRAARTLHKALAGDMVRRFETVLPNLARVDVDSPVAGRTIERVEAQGKWMSMRFSGDLVLLTHMRMSGSWHIYRPGEPWKRRSIHKRIVIETEEFLAVAFNVPIAEFHSADSLRRHAQLQRLGPSLFEPEFDDARILQNLRAQANAEVGEAFLNQTVLAGVGNVFKSEVCFICGVNPFRRVETLTMGEMTSLVASARKLMLENGGADARYGPAAYNSLRRTTGRQGPEECLWVYRRGGRPCLQCDSKIEAGTQGENARITYWCPHCQPMVEPNKTKIASAG